MAGRRRRISPPPKSTSTKRLASAVALMLFSSPITNVTSFPLVPSSSSSSSPSRNRSSSSHPKVTKILSPRSNSHLQVLPSSFYYGDGSSPGSSNTNVRSGSRNNNHFHNPNAVHFQTALAIVPPLPDWDRLQRARHFARDQLFHKWPPAIRLFHPFRGVTALEVAQVVEELELEPFDITLDTWVIVPHLEAVEAAWVASEAAPNTEDDLHLNDDASVDYAYYDSQREEDAEIRKLIEAEERIGLEKAKARKERMARAKAKKEKELEMERRAKQQQQPQQGWNGNTTTTTTTRSASTAIKTKKSPTALEEDDDEEDEGQAKKNNKSNSLDPSEMYEQQQQQMEDFGGPCILCLEPNAESKQLLQDLRGELAGLLHHKSDYSSPSSIYSWNYIQEPMFQPESYRPLIPIGSFESLQPAMEVARRLKGLWGEPLTFRVNDLHVLSCRDDYTDWEDDNNRTNTDSLIDPEVGATFSSQQYYNFSPESIGEWIDQPWGCNARIMLLGQEEQQQDDDDDDDPDAEDSIAKQIELLLEEGQAGGNDISNDYTILDDEEEINASDIELWLDNDEDWDEGMQVVIGRTHFFTGDQRNYRGMPASSVVDSKDRSMGDVGGTQVSGLARRRRTSTRKGNNQWENGEYGRRQSDYLPWTKQERSPKKVERLLEDYYSKNNSRKQKEKAAEAEMADEGDENDEDEEDENENGKDDDDDDDNDDDDSW